MNKTRHYIRTLMLMLLLLAGGGMANEAWAKKVTYHILTKPFTVRNYNNTGDWQTNIRVEALQCTSEESTVGLPDQFKSPLAKNFRYWKEATSTYDYLYDYKNNNKIVSSKYYIYQCGKDKNVENWEYVCLGKEITTPEETSTDADGFPNDIYVTYDYVNDGESEDYKNDFLELNGETDYNVTVNISGKQRFMCFNRSRNNRVANALASALTGEQLVSDDFVIPDNSGSKLGWSWGSWGPIGLHLGFKFTGQDPYNITIMTSYQGNEVHVTDAITNVDVTPYSSTNQNKATIKPYKGATLFGKLGNNQMWFDASNDRHYKVLSGCGQNDWKDGNKYQDCKTRYEATPEQARYDTWVGFYRNETPTMNSYALLPNTNGEYLFVGSKMNQNNTTYQPDKNGYYALYNDNSNNPCFKFQALSNAYKTNLYEIRSYVLHIKTHGSKTEFTKTMKWSDAMASDKIVDHIPEALKRKYCSYKAYSDAALTKEITTFTDAINNVKGEDGKIDISKLEDGKVAIWLDYTVSESFPFETLQAVNSVYNYQNARWYTMRMNGKAEQKNIAYNSSNSLITGSASIGSESDLHYGETCANTANAMVAFIGDPYELKIISRAASESASANRYIGCATDAADNTTLNTDKEDTSGNIITWEMVYENTDMGNFVLRQFNTYDNPRYIGWNTGETNKPVVYSSKTPTNNNRIRVVELERVSYTYWIVRNDEGDIAVKASASHDIGKALRSWEDIPEIIRSPFLAPSYTASVTFYATIENAKAKTPTISNAPYDSNRNIYVRYAYVTPLTEKTYNVTLNTEYIYTNIVTDDNTIYNKKNITSGSGSEAENGHFQWALDYSDPYNMTIKNLGKNKYIQIASRSNDAVLNWNIDVAYATRFIAKSGSISGTYEVMLATGSDIDASTEYYNIGRPDANTVKLYDDDHYITGNATLQFQLFSTTASEVVYHLIDKNGKDLLQVATRHLAEDKPAFPPQYHSPLVDAYHYYQLTDFIVSDGTYTLNGTPSEIPTVSTNVDIYVTYDVNDLVNLKSGQLYLLKYEAGEYFKQENGSDGLTADAQKAIYPYVNGDGNFFVYGQEQYDLQQEGAASTRTRWAWYVQSDPGTNGDPYHVTIKSRQTESYPITNSSEYNAYFMTYKPEGYSEVVTTLAWPGMSGETATEYMVLGSEGQYQLVTTYEIGGSRYVVNSFEQYWKTWDTIRKKIYGESSAKENDSDPIIIPNDTKYPYENPTEETLRHYLENTLNWHSYERWAYAKRWNGYNNGYSSAAGTHETKKGWETIEHWYQTVDMGEGYFNFVKTDINPVLILLDQHGWEIMRKPIPTDPEDPQKDAKYAAIRPYNSPMVKEYAFWATAKKRSGFHQYYLLSDRIGGDTYTSTDLTNLPPYDSKNVHDKKGNLNDQYVTYIVKDEYAQTYNPKTATGKPFLIEQGIDHKYATTNAEGTALTASPIPHDGDMNAHILNDVILDTEKWYVKPNANIDIEMGYNDTGHSWTKKKADGSWDNKNPNAYEHYKYKDSLIAQYINDKDSLGYFSFSNGFDPYNIQISSVSASSKFMKTNANGATLDEGSIIGSYPSDPGTIVMGDNEISIKNPKARWYDSRNLDVTNATFMAVQDAAGNMQLMPRFDHATRMSEFSTLIAPTDAEVATTYTKLYRPEVYEYLIIDNDGHESLRYKSGGDLTPQTPNHFKSPLATNFTYYATATESSGTYSSIEDEIKGALDGATLTDNMVYVRYEYDEDADNLNILKGNWLTMQLNNLNVYCNSNSLYGTNSHALTATDATDLENQAKKLTETGVYYFKVGTDYYEVTVTSGAGETFATYDTPTDATSEDWGKASSPYQLTATDDVDMVYQAKRLTGTGDYYFRVGSTEPYTYKLVSVSSAYNESDATYTPNPPTSGDFSSQWDASKPLVVNADGKKWQWKFLKNQQIEPDPYAVYLFSRNAKDVELLDGSRFAILSHSSGDYALAKAGRGDYTYQFLNGDGRMSTSDAAEIDTEAGFTSSTGTFSFTNSQVKLTNEVQFAFTYKVYTNEGKFAIQANQTQEEVENNDWAARIPDEIKTPLLNLDQFRYYDKDDVVFGTGDPVPIASIDTDKNLSHLYGLYDDEVVVRYTSYDPSVTEYQVPNVRNTPGSIVAKGIGSNDAPLDLSKTMAYNVIWHNDNMMTTTTGTDVVGHANQEIKKDAKYEWKIGGNDPYAMKFYNVYASNNASADRYITAASADNDADCTLSGDATTFMLLPKDNYDYGMLAITGNKDYKLTITDDGNTGTKEDAKITIGDPAKFIIFALATHKVIYHLMIKNIGQKVIIPYKGKEIGGTLNSEYLIQESGTTLRDLTTKDTSSGESGHIDGDLYQLGESLKAIGSRAGTTTGLFARDSIYCYDAGHISLGDKLEVPSVFYRPNVKYRFIVEGVYDSSTGQPVSEINDKYKGWETETMGDDEGLLHNTVFINIVYEFADLSTNSGSDFVKSVNDNKWYSFDTNDATPQLAQYTGTLQTKSGYATHYTNDYLWTPVGDAYGFKMYNRYACKNQGQTNLVMTTASIAAGQAITMHDEVIDEGNGGRDIYELIANSTTTPGYFRVHPMMNKSGIQYYMNCNSSTGALTLSATPTEWTFGLNEDMMRPYREAAGYVGGLNAAGKAAYDTAPENETLFDKLVRLQDVIYNHDNNPAKANFIVHYTPGYYRLHSQPGSSGITTKRYVSGYTHKIELTAGDGSTAIPMHFYEVEEYNMKNPVFSDLGIAGTNYTGTNATQGDIPLSTVTSDPASIFKFTGENESSVTMSTQGLYVYQNKMTTSEGVPTSFSIIDLGGGVIALQNGTGSLTSFLNYNQNSTKYDLKFNTAAELNAASALESTRWCMQPVKKDVAAGDGEMELRVTTNNGGNDYYYATFCAPFDVLLTNEKDEAYVLPTDDGWPTITPPATSAMIHPKKIGKYNTGGYADNNKFVPAGTPVIIRTTNPIGYVTMALPTTTPSTPVSCVFSGKYLEQVLTHGDDYVYVFGRSLGTFVKDESFATNGHFSSITPTVSTDIGFYVNANPNKEESEYKVSWTRNNKYVYANKIYYRAGVAPGVSPAPKQNRAPEFIPVVFDDDEEQDEELKPNGTREVIGDGCVYDLTGRKVATREQVEDGSWKQRVATGIYIINGKKIRR